MTCLHKSKKIRIDPHRRNCRDPECIRYLKFKRTSKYACNRFHLQIDCDMPVQWACSVCSNFDFGHCESTKQERCKSCSARWLSRHKYKIGHELRQRHNWVEMTLTREGENKFAWDGNLCRLKHPHKHSGTLGCKTFAVDNAVSNTEITADYTHWVTYLRRAFKNSDIKILRVYEAQDRGLIHIHLIVVGLPAMSERSLRKKISPINKKWNFGSRQGFHLKNVIHATPHQVSRATFYVSKYLTKGSKGWDIVDKSTGEIKFSRQRRISYTRNFSLSMKEIKALRLKEYRARNLRSASYLLAEMLGAIPIREAEGCPNAPPLITIKPFTQLFII